MTFRAHANLLTDLSFSPTLPLSCSSATYSVCKVKPSAAYYPAEGCGGVCAEAGVITGISNVACDIYDTLRSKRVGQRQRNIIRLIISSVPCAMCDVRCALWMRTWMSLLTSSVSELRRAEIVTISAVCLVPICIPYPAPPYPLFLQARNHAHQARPRRGCS